MLSSQSQTDTTERPSTALEPDAHPSHLPVLENETAHLDPAHGRGTKKRLRRSTSPSVQPSSGKGQHNLHNDIRDDGLTNGDNKKRAHDGRRRHKATLDEAPLESHTHEGDYGRGLLDAADNIPIHDGKSRRNSSKRPAGDEPLEAFDRITDNDTALPTSGRSHKRTRLLRDESAFAAGLAVSSNTSRSDQSREIVTSSRTRVADPEDASRPLANSELTAISAGIMHVPDARIAEASSSSKSSVHLDSTETGGSVQAPCSLTIPMAPTFTGDVLRQRRLLARSEREKRQREKGTKKKIMSDGSSSAAPSSSKQVRFLLRLKRQQAISYALTHTN